MRNSAARRVRAGLLAILLGLCAAGPAAAAEVLRTTLVVRDLPRALALYRDILGFTAGPARVQPADGNIGRALRLPPGGEVSFTPLADADGAERLGLIAHLGVSRPAAPAVSVAFVVEGLDALVLRLRGAGFATTPVVRLRPGELRAVRETTFVDADGHLVVLQERAAAAALAERLVGAWRDAASGETLTVAAAAVEGAKGPALALAWRAADGAAIRRRVWTLADERDGPTLDYYTLDPGPDPRAGAPIPRARLRGYGDACRMGFTGRPGEWLGRIDPERCTVAARSGRSFAFAVELAVAIEGPSRMTFAESGVTAGGETLFRVPAAGGRQTFQR